MVSSDLLDVVLGVVFAWFLLSLAVAVVVEAVNWLTRARSKLLWRSLSQLFHQGVTAADARLRTVAIKRPDARDDLRPVPEPGGSADRLREKMVSAPTSAPQLTQQLYELLRRRVPDPSPGSFRTRISSIPTEVFGDAFESLAARTVTKRTLLDVAGEGALRTAIQSADLPDGVLDRDATKSAVGAAVAEQFDAAWEAASSLVTLEDIEALLEDNPALLARVRAAVSSVANDQRIMRARQEIERWFDGAMEGLTTFFRRQSRKILAIAAIPVVLLSNAGLFGLIDRLREDQDLRAAAATAAGQWAAQDLPTTDSGQLDLDKACERVLEVDSDPTTSAATTSTTAPTTTTTEPATTTTESGASTTTTEPDAIAEARRRFRCASLLLGSSELLGPIGVSQLSDEFSAANDDGDFWQRAGSWIWPEFVGRVVTWAALLFGAAFWYDVLKRLVGLKGTVSGKSTGSG